jgi:hypothetical protein
MDKVSYDPEETLEQLRHFDSLPHPALKEHWYGLGRCLRTWLRLPRWLPINIYLHHGPYIFDEPYQYMLMVRQPIFVTRASQATFLRDRHGITAHVMGTPFVHYRKLKGIEQAADATGTVAYPSHSTHHIDQQLDWDAYAGRLAALPDKFQPVRVCLYWRDFLLGRWKPFAERGLQVCTAGHIFDPDFADRFYAIMHGARFTCGNSSGSHVYYSTELGIPHFLVHDWPQHYNLGTDPYYDDKPYSFDPVAYTKREMRLYQFDSLDEVHLRPQAIARARFIMGLDEEIDTQVLRRVIARSALDYVRTRHVEPGLARVRAQIAGVGRRVLRRAQGRR